MEWTEILKEMNDNGYILEIAPHNQIQNGYRVEDVLSGELPLITYTATITDEELDHMLFAESHDTFVDAVESAIAFYQRDTKEKNRSAKRP